MTGLTFTLREAPPERLDLSPLTPARLAGLSCAKIERIAIGTTRLGVAVGDVFRLSGEDAADLVFAGGSTRFDRLGSGLDGGSIRLEGDAGGYLGLAMAGGTITVAGSLTGPYGGSAMTGGLIRVAGHAADATAAALPGAVAGMAGGTLIVGGRAGELVGDRMRGGVILVAGGAGRLCAARMLGGTIVAASLGPRAGQGMRRGTLIAGSADDIEPTFVFAGRYAQAFLPLLGNWVGGIAGEAFARLVPTSADRYRGDMADVGEGELLIGPPE